MSSNVVKKIQKYLTKKRVNEHDVRREKLKKTLDLVEEEFDKFTETIQFHVSQDKK